jgi:excisionase family DNA binding protein
MSAALVAIFLPDGRVMALPADQLRAALAAGEGLGLAAQVTTAAVQSATPERWLNSEELGELIGIHATTVEGMARAKTIPSIRAGKALRFKLSEVEAAIKAQGRD